MNECMCPSRYTPCQWKREMPLASRTMDQATETQIQTLLFANYVIVGKLTHPLILSFLISKWGRLSATQNWCEDQMKSQTWHIAWVAEVAAAYLFLRLSPAFSVTSFIPTFIMVLQYTKPCCEVNGQTTNLFTVTTNLPSTNIKLIYSWSRDKLLCIKGVQQISMTKCFEDEMSKCPREVKLIYTLYI